MKTETFLNNFGNKILTYLRKTERFGSVGRTVLINILSKSDYSRKGESVTETATCYRRTLDHMINSGVLTSTKQGRTNRIAISQDFTATYYEAGTKEKKRYDKDVRIKAHRLFRAEYLKEAVKAMKRNARAARKANTKRVEETETMKNDSANTTGSKTLGTVLENNGIVTEVKKTISFTLEATHDSIMETVKGMLKRVGEKGKFCRIQYKTKSGEVVERTIKLKVTKYLKTNFTSEEERIAHKARMAKRASDNPHLLNAWDLTAALQAKKTATEKGTVYQGSSAYRSYDVNQMLSIRGAGQMITLDDRLNKVVNGVKTGIPHLSIAAFDTKVSWMLHTTTKQTGQMEDILTGARKRKHSTSVKQTIEMIVDRLGLKETGYTMEKDSESVTATHTNGNKVIEKTGTVTVSESKGCTKKKVCEIFGTCHGCNFRKLEKAGELGITPLMNGFR